VDGLFLPITANFPKTFEGAGIELTAHALDESQNENQACMASSGIAGAFTSKSIWTKGIQATRKSL
jgi:hypothetical protein